MDNLLSASCRVAFSALIHDIGKFAQRAEIDVSKDLMERNIHTFCPFYNNHHSHIHAAYTGIAVDEIERCLPKINNTETYPFQQDGHDDSIICAAAKHHKPNTYLQNVISTADRLSSAFERTKYEEYNQTADNENYIQARMIPLFEKVLNNEKQSFDYRYKLSALNSDSIFPVKHKMLSKDEAKAEYKLLWNKFIEDVKNLKNRGNWERVLDNFDTLYSIYTQNIPSASAFQTIADVSLYDHSKSTAALATALWRYHNETNTESVENLEEDQVQKFLLVQGDVSGIQKFIFQKGGATQKKAYKLLRGRSFYISLICECAALKILHDLDYPSTSQIMNAAGKFVILVHNTPEVLKKLGKIKTEINQWLLDHFFGEVCVGLAWEGASQSDFEESNFKNLQKKIFKSLDVAKYQAFDMVQTHVAGKTKFFDHFESEFKVCEYDGKYPAIKDEEEHHICPICSDILLAGEKLAKNHSISLLTEKTEDSFQTDIFGYYVDFAKSNDAVRCWDISLPTDYNETVFKGLARRNVNAYVPKFLDREWENPIFNGIKDEDFGVDKIKTFEYLARMDCHWENDGSINGKIIGKPALMAIKGDIDNLGNLMQNGIEKPTFATMAQLSRQINNFFTIFLPALCHQEQVAKNVYTVFAGGDDFMFITPWLDGIKLVSKLKDDFKSFVCTRDDITFSVGLSMTHAGEPVSTIVNRCETALDKAKAFPNKEGKEPTKNAICCFGQVVSNEDYKALIDQSKQLKGWQDKYELSTGYVYNLQYLCEKAENVANGNFADAIWRSQLTYKTVRMVEMDRKVADKDKESVANEITTQIGSAIETYKLDYRIALFTFLYQQREG